MNILLPHAAATLFMTGLIWMVQVVHYPLLAKLGVAEFPAYHDAHVRLITLVVGVPMILELGTTIVLLGARPPGIPSWAAWLGALLLAIVWGSTALLQVPTHDALAEAFDPALVDRLVTGNWIRTLAWTARSAVALGMLAMLRPR